MEKTLPQNINYELYRIYVITGPHNQPSLLRSWSGLRNRTWDARKVCLIVLGKTLASVREFRLPPGFSNSVAHQGRYLLTYSMVQSPSWEANWFAASQEIPRISRNPKVHHRTHNRPPTVCILGQPNPVHIPTSHLLEIHPNIIRTSKPRSPQWSASLRFPHKTLYTPLSSPIRATFPAHLILLNFITRTILGEEYKSFSSSLCNLLNSPVTSSLLGPNILLYTIWDYLLIPWCRVLEKPTGLQLVKKFPAFHGTRRFITALTSVRHLSLFWASPIQSIYTHPTSWWSILILSTHLRLGLPSGLLPIPDVRQPKFAVTNQRFGTTERSHLLDPWRYDL